MQKISVWLTASLVLSAGIIGVVYGYYLTPEYQLGMYEKTMDLGPVDRWTDLRYIDSMIAHHLTALDLANQAEVASQRPEILKLVADIKQTEPKLIDELYGWKKMWYKSQVAVKATSQVQLGGAGETFDLRFLNALIAHHEAGIKMATEIKSKSSRVEILDNADAVEEFLTTTKKQLLAWRQEWYGVKGTNE